MCNCQFDEFFKFFQIDISSSNPFFLWILEKKTKFLIKLFLIFGTKLLLISKP